MPEDIPRDRIVDAVRERVERLDGVEEGEVREGDFGDPLFVVRRDLDHLDADALNDRLAAWAKREVHPSGFECVSAFVSFHHAEPATGDNPDLDVQAEWRNIEAVLRLDADELGQVTGKELDRFVDLVPAFLRTVGREGRPENWRNVWEGAAE